ncbi:hypothetical protein [Streptomyces sp. NPDC056707]|uniref:hypothetical protein n=1 Tax=Streptomyces sp. NPDC056707 TaxID=3345919 RepID=UPI0036BA642E
MTDAPDADEQRARHWWRRPGAAHAPLRSHEDDAPDAAARDWLDRLYEDDQEPVGEQTTRWWSLRSTGTKEQQPATAPEESSGPSVHVTITQPTASAPSPGRSRRRRWLATHGALAGVGWYIGLGPAMADLLTSTGRSAPAVGIGLVLISTLFGTFLPGLPYVPPQLRPLVVALCRIPACTAVLALALHAPNALI